MAKQTRRQRNQLPNCYYEGYLEKSSLKDETPRKLWTCLCGNTLFFFNDKRDSDYIETLELSGFVSITGDSSNDRTSDAAVLNLQIKDRSIKLTVPNAEMHELWKGYIRSVAELRVPPSLNLLPGQIRMLTEAVEKEKERLKNIAPPADTNNKNYVSLQGDMPSCYHALSRLEATLLLEREEKRGNLLLRPGSNGSSFAITTRQDLNGPVLRHYRVARKPEGGFIIDVDSPVPCATLHDVVTYFVEKSEGVLIPLVIEEPYEKNIYFIVSDNESGESIVQRASSNLSPPNIPPPDVPSRSGPANRPPLGPKPKSKPIQESFYMNNNAEEKEKETEDSSDAQQSQSEKKALQPPVPPRKPITATPIPAVVRGAKVNPDSQKQMPPAALSELKQKLVLKAKFQK